MSTQAWATMKDANRAPAGEGSGLINSDSEWTTIIAQLVKTCRSR
jgi:hypothetical protein